MLTIKKKIQPYNCTDWYSSLFWQKGIWRLQIQQSHAIRMSNFVTNLILCKCTLILIFVYIYKENDNMWLPEMWGVATCPYNCMVELY